MNADTIILLSGGLDSTLLLADALDGGRVPLCLSFNYGQRHGLAELNASRAVAEHYRAPRCVMEIGQTFSHMKKASWLIGAREGSAVVPGRNGILLSIAAGVAESVGAGEVWYGANLDDREGFPDCRPAWVDAMSRVVELGSGDRVRIRAPYLNDSKASIILQSLKWGVPLEKTHTCYNGARPACGECQACRARLHAFQVAGMIDPLPYR